MPQWALLCHRACRGLGHLRCHVPCAIGLSLFQFYGYLSQQQNMMQDYVRTGTYQRAILQNHTDFKDKVSGPGTHRRSPAFLHCPKRLFPLALSHGAMSSALVTFFFAR